MLECLILGDSIAVGVSQIRTECVAIAKSGINSTDWNKKHINQIKPANTTIISLGSNDWDGKTYDNLRKMRKEIDGRVYWILPSATRKPKERQAVLDVANEFSDFIIERPKEMSPDGIHPTYRGYAEIARETKKND
jgi:lysophospholipase L1-like esterase